MIVREGAVIAPSGVAVAVAQQRDGSMDVNRLFGAGKLADSTAIFTFRGKPPGDVFRL